MNVQRYIQRLPLADAMSLNVVSVQEAEEIVAWALNERFLFVGEAPEEPGIFLFRYCDPGSSWWWDLRSDEGIQMLRLDPVINPGASAEIQWPGSMGFWETYDGSA